MAVLIKITANIVLTTNNVALDIEHPTETHNMNEKRF